MPSLSVIIPAWQAQEHIGEAVRSALAQSFSDLEVIIASDDGADYLALLRGQGIHDPRLRQVFTEGSGTGVSNARNCAMRAAAGRIIASLDADDMLMPDALDALHPLAQQYGAAYSDVEYVDYATGETLPNYNHPMPNGPLPLDAILRSNLHTYAWVVFDRERLPRLKWQEWIRYFEDFMFFAECCASLGAMYHHSGRLYMYRRREGSMCNRPETPKDFQQDVAAICASLEKEHPAFASHPETGRILLAYMRRRHELEALFEQGLHSGNYRDWLEFMQQNLSRFYQPIATN